MIWMTSDIKGPKLIELEKMESRVQADGQTARRVTDLMNVVRGETPVRARTEEFNQHEDVAMEARGAGFYLTLPFGG